MVVTRSEPSDIPRIVGKLVAARSPRRYQKFPQPFLFELALQTYVHIVAQRILVGYGIVQGH